MNLSKFYLSLKCLKLCLVNPFDTKKTLVSDALPALLEEFG